MGPFVQGREAGDCGKQHELLSSAIHGDVDSASATTFLYDDRQPRLLKVMLTGLLTISMPTLML